MWDLLRRRDFRILFTGLTASMTGESLLLLMLAVWVKELTGSSSMAGLALLAVVAPAIVSPLLGWVVDQFPRRGFLVVANAATAVALTPLFAVHGRAQLWIIFVVAVLYGLSMFTVTGALDGLIQQLLPPADLAAGNGLLQTVRQGLRLVGPLGGAALFTTLGAATVVGCAIVGLLLAAAAIALIRVPAGESAAPGAPAPQGWAGEVSAGVRFLVRQPALRRVTVGLVIVATVIGFLETIVFSYVDEGLHRPPAFVSVLICLQGAGAVVGGLVAARVVRRLGEVGGLGLGVACFAVGAAFLIYPQLVLGLTGSVLFGFGLTIATVSIPTLIQRTTPSALIGRVSTASGAVFSLPQTLSIALGAGLIQLIDYRLLFVVIAVVVTGAAAYLWAGRNLAAQPAA
ncbi:MFS transporter [Luedemannella flava]|uniref:MFS transporter n=1 Tax=Luedemannella flava TaxID=349316 RepID=A0ABN2LNE9_9ACTN